MRILLYYVELVLLCNGESWNVDEEIRKNLNLAKM